MSSNPVLLKDEHIVWQGVPRLGLLLRSSDALLIPFSLLWGGFAVFWNASVWTMGAPTPFALFGLPFLVVGLYVTIGRFFHDAYLRGRLRYYVTDKRIIIGREGSSSLKSLDISRLPVVEMSERADGSGSISFGETGLFSNAGRSLGLWVPALSSTPQFIRIDNVRSVYEMIQKYAQ